MFLHCLNGHLLFSKNQVILLSTVLKNQKTKIIEFLYRKSFQILYKNKSVNSDSDENYYLILNNDIAFENLFVIHF